jgi:uncharacterized membrane protein
MKLFKKPLRTNKYFELIYKIGIGIKGFDGLIELVVGVALLAAPQIVHSVLMSLLAEVGERQTRTLHFIAEYIARLDADLAKNGLVFLIIFLITHGLVKLVLVYCLLKEIVKAYPAALAILSAFLVYQLYVFIIHPTISMALFTILDAIIIWLVWGEYKDLKVKK